MKLSVAVCVKFINRFIASLKSDEKTEPAKIEKAFKKFCKPTKKDDNRFVSLFCRQIIISDLFYNLYTLYYTYIHVCILCLMVITSIMNDELDSSFLWLNSNKLSVNVTKKTQFMVFSLKKHITAN